MYSVTHPPVRLNGFGLGGAMDGSGTINPAALSAPVMPTNPSALGLQPSPRGVKRSRSPESHEDSYAAEYADDDESKRRKRGRPPKAGRVPESPVSATQQLPPQAVQTPQIASQTLPQTSPPQTSPTNKTTPTKTTVIKALPTVRDHTTDQLNDEGDEYIPRETDPEGEKKVSPNGQALGGREYRCRTFFVPGRGDKLFMLATECARVLSYRDSYLLFNKNRSLYKIIANQAEKDDLIAQEILPYSYRSRQIAIVTAKSMFRQFGSRLIKDGRRVRDDYWEAKARKQGFTEEDAAGEKRPGAARQRESLAQEHHAGPLTALPHGQIIYSNGPSNMPSNLTLAPIPMINMPQTDDMRPRDYSNVQRPRHEMSGAPYMDRLGSSNSAEILNQAVQTADFNKAMSQQRMNRTKYLEDMWRRPHEPPAAPEDVEGQGSLEGQSIPVTSQNLQSPQIPSTASVMGNPQQAMMSHAQQGSAQMGTPQSYAQHGQNLVAQSPARSMHQSLRADQMGHRSPSFSMGQPGQPQPGYGYPQNQMWPPQQPQPSPLQPHAALQQYGQQSHQQSPHPQPSPMHAPPQLHHAQSSGSMHGSQMGYQTMGGMNTAGYPGMGRNPYQPSPSPQQFMPQSSGGQQSGMAGWAPSQHAQQGWYGS